MDRRKFLNWVGLGALATSLPVAIAACQPEPTQPEATEPAPPDSDSADAGSDTSTPTGDSVVVGTVADLDSQGFVSSRPAFASGAVIAVRAPDSPDTLYAVDSRCTHQGCSVEWEADTSEFVCPCHRSKFAPDGSVTSGPATEPLATFPVQIENDQVMVTPS